MRWRVILWVSLAANLVLAIGWSVNAHRNAARIAAVIEASNTVSPVIKTNVQIRRQFFAWHDIEASDYRIFIQNMREIQCPEQTIRDIIIADVNALYARRKATEVVLPEQQWWRSDPDTNLAVSASAKLNELDQERRTLLASLLGPGWETGDMLSLPRPSRAGIPLDGPVLGILPADVKLSVQEIALRGQDRVQNYLEAQRLAGKTADPAELVRLRQETRNELAHVLTPPQIEEFLLRYSQTANALRTELGQLKYFDASAEEFRELFRATDAIDLRLQALGNANDPQSQQQRQDLMQQRENALRQALGEDRYAEYESLRDPGYRDAYAMAQQAGRPDAAGALYEIKTESDQELAKLRATTNLTPAQLAVEAKRIELEQLKAVAQALGQALPEESAAAKKPEQPRTPSVVLNGNESLGFLARLYGVGPEELKAANPNVNFDKIRPGQVIQLPYGMLPPPPPITVRP